jgi:hypothetical protein
MATTPLWGTGSNRECDAVPDLAHPHVWLGFKHPLVGKTLKVLKVFRLLRLAKMLRLARLKRILRWVLSADLVLRSESHPLEPRGVPRS